MIKIMIAIWDGGCEQDHCIMSSADVNEDYDNDDDDQLKMNIVEY